MSGASTYNPAEADQLERLTDDLTTKEWHEVWEIYAQRGYDAAALVAQKYKTAFKARYKVVEAPPPVATTKAARPWSYADACRGSLRSDMVPR